jgi:hypothetical protein
MAVFHTSAVPPSRGSSSLATIGSTRKSSDAAAKVVSVNSARTAWCGRRGFTGDRAVGDRAGTHPL